MFLNLKVAVWIGVLAGWVAVAPDTALAAAFDCKANHCGIAIDAPYPNLVVGTIDGIATPTQTAALLAAAQAQGLWHEFPASGGVFAQKVQPISVSIAPGRSITVLAGTYETNFMRLRVGELVRFAPHRGIHEAPQPNNPYWVGVGCVALLCAAGDAPCEAGYHSGLYRRADGAALDKTGRLVLPGGIAIDPMSMRPRTN